MVARYTFRTHVLKRVEKKAGIENDQINIWSLVTRFALTCSSVLKKKRGSEFESESSGLQPNA